MRAADDVTVRTGGHAPDQCIERGKDRKADACRRREKRRIVHAEEREQFGNHREGTGEVHPCQKQRQKEHGQHLRVDAPPDLPCGHADLLHDGKTRRILRRLGDLLVVQDQHGGTDKDRRQQNAEEEQTAERTVEVSTRNRAAVAEELRIAVLFFCFIRPEPTQQRAPERGLRVVVRRRVKRADIARVAAFLDKR